MIVSALDTLRTRLPPALYSHATFAVQLAPVSTARREAQVALQQRVRKLTAIIGTYCNLWPKLLSYLLAHAQGFHNLHGMAVRHLVAGLPVRPCSYSNKGLAYG